MKLIYFLQKIPKYLITITVLFLISCNIINNTTLDQGTYFLNKEFKSISQNERIKFLIIHYTALNDEDSLNILTKGKVSAHYLITKNIKFKLGKPIIFQLVDEKKRAWHAGISNWNGKINLNDISIGIEIVNYGFSNSLPEKIWFKYTEKQIKTIAILMKDIIHRYNIAPENILGHSDITIRKQDPGKIFPWEKLAKVGIGAWPDKKTVDKYLSHRLPTLPVDVLLMQKNLNRYGYDQIPQNGILDEKTKNIISAFQMHFRSTNISGNPDAETESIVMALIEKYNK